ncbi:hypothetical protein EUTSA_v10017579mg, partial [Eutrema salsugineum]
MDDRATRICDALGVSREEAFYYLEAYRGDVDAAIEACRSKSLPLPLPSPTVQSSLGNEKSASEAPDIPPLMTDSDQSSNQPPGPQEEQPPQSRPEKIKAFCEAALGASLDEAVRYLERRKWNIQEAVGDFFDECRPTPSQRKSNRPVYPPPVGGSNAPLTIGRSHPQDASALTGLFQNTQGSGNSTQTSEENPSPPRDAVDRICNAASVSREEALFYLEGFKWEFDTAMEACRTKTLPPVNETAEAPPTLQPQSINEQLISQRQSNNEQLIRSFQVVAVGTTREVAIAYLEACGWDVDQAVSFCIEGSSVEEAYSASIMSLMKTKDALHSLKGSLPSQSQFEASCSQIGSSSSSINACPTETQVSREEAGEDKVTVAIPGMGSSHVDGNAVEEVSSTETFPDPFAIQDRTIVGAPTAPTTITVSIVLADDGSGASIDLPFRSNQTVRDIRNAIDERTPENDRDYYLQSMTGVEYKDMDTTVHRINQGGSTILLQ